MTLKGCQGVIVNGPVTFQKLSISILIPFSVYPLLLSRKNGGSKRIF